MNMFHERLHALQLTSRSMGIARGESPRDAGLADYFGMVTSRDLDSCLFVFRPDGAARQILCCFAAELQPAALALEDVLAMGQHTHMIGRHVVPSVYKPFEFEVLSLAVLAEA